MIGYAFHPDTFADLDEIWDYIAENNINAAGLEITTDVLGGRFQAPPHGDVIRSERHQPGIRVQRLKEERRPYHHP